MLNISKLIIHETGRIISIICRIVYMSSTTVLDSFSINWMFSSSCKLFLPALYTTLFFSILFLLLFCEHYASGTCHHRGKHRGSARFGGPDFRFVAFKKERWYFFSFSLFMEENLQISSRKCNSETAIATVDNVDWQTLEFVADSNRYRYIFIFALQIFEKI